MTYLVMGATGNVGGAVVASLLERGASVRAITRSERSWPDGVEGFIGDAGEPDGLKAAGEGVEGAFMMSGYAAEAGLLDELSDAHVVLLSSSSAPVLGDEGNAMAEYHLASERALKGSGAEWTILRPSSFQANVLRWKPDLDEGDTVRAPFADVPVAMVDPGDIGAVAATALAESGHRGQAYRLTGPEALTPPEQVAIVGSAIGRELRCEPVPDEQARRDMEGICPRSTSRRPFRSSAARPQPRPSRSCCRQCKRCSAGRPAPCMTGPPATPSGSKAQMSAQAVLAD